MLLSIIYKPSNAPVTNLRGNSARLVQVSIIHITTPAVKVNNKETPNRGHMSKMATTTSLANSFGLKPFLVINMAPDKCTSGIVNWYRRISMVC